MKKVNLVVSTINILLALTGLVYLLCLVAKAYPAVTPVAADICLGLFVVTGWMAIAIFQATEKAFEPVVLAVPCPRCGGMQYDRSVCGDCVEAICWEQVSRAEASGSDPDLSFEKWFEVNEDSLMEEVAENDLDREADFDFESWAEARFFESK